MTVKLCKRHKWKNNWCMKCGTVKHPYNENDQPAKMLAIAEVVEKRENYLCIKCSGETKLHASDSNYCKSCEVAYSDEDYFDQIAKIIEE